jgi:hypothetical protein
LLGQGRSVKVAKLPYPLRNGIRMPPQHLTQRKAISMSVPSVVNARIRFVVQLTVLASISVTSSVHGQEAEKEHPPAKKQDKREVVELFNGKDLGGWKVTDENDFERHGKVEAKDGLLLLNKGNPMTGIVYKGEPPRNNYELTVEAKRIEGDDFFCGITFPVDKSYCSLIVGGWGGGVTGLSNVNNMAAVENETTGFTEFENDRWYSIRLRVTPQEIEAWIDSEQIIDLSTDGRKFDIWWEQEPLRPLGFATWHTGGAFRKMRIRRLAK